jgi:radical SAM superfamily enzyme YgiQ (UPF0313 family)
MGRTVHTVVLATPAPVTHRTAEENLGLGYLAAVLRREGYAVRVIDGWLAGLTVEQLSQAVLAGPEPLMLGFSCYRTNMERTMAVVVRLRDGGITAPVVVGGYGPTFHADDFLSAGFDVVVRGEGEGTALDLARHFATGVPALAAIDGISFLRDGRRHDTPPRVPVSDLDALPAPARDTFDLTRARRSLVHLASSRGCQAHCTFCSIIAFERIGGGPTWRQRSIPGLVDELESLAARGATHFKLIDDSLIEPPRDAAWCAELADAVTGRGLSVRLRGSIRADRADEEVVAHLRRAGFFSFSCGIENFSESALRRMAKTASLAQNLAALDRFKRHGIYVQAGHILFDQATTLTELEDNYTLMRRYDWTVSKGVFTEMYAAAGTPFTRALDRRGLLSLDAMKERDLRSC